MCRCAVLTSQSAPRSVGLTATWKGLGRGVSPTTPRHAPPRPTTPKSSFAPPPSAPILVASGIRKPPGDEVYMSMSIYKSAKFRWPRTRSTPAAGGHACFAWRGRPARALPCPALTCPNLEPLHFPLQLFLRQRAARKNTREFVVLSRYGGRLAVRRRAPT